MIIKLKSEVWNALKTCVATTSERYYLQGIYFDIPNRCAVATDGHTLLRAPLDNFVPQDASEESFILEVNGRQAPKGGEAWIDTAEKRIEFLKKSGKEDRTEVYKVIDEKYPEYQKVIPDPDKLQDAFQKVAFNPSLIGRTLGALDVTPVAHLRAVDDSGDKPFVIPIAAYPDVTFVVMPCRV